MTPEEHYVEAERLLTDMESDWDQLVQTEGLVIRSEEALAHYTGFLVLVNRAQVHATLATARVLPRIEED